MKRCLVASTRELEYIMYEGQVDSTKRLNILYEDGERHYHVIAKLTGAMARKYVCKVCNKACTIEVTRAFDQTCSDCMTATRAHSRSRENPVLNSTRTLEATRVSLTTNRALNRNFPCANENDVARRVDGS